MKNLIFTPILKTKRSSEFNALKEVRSLLDKHTDLFPYIECIKSISQRDVTKYLNLLENDIFFFEPLDNDIPVVLSNIDNYKSNAIISYRVINKTTTKIIEDFIQINRSHNRTFGIKLDDADDRFIPTLKMLNENEYLFIELNGTAYDSSSFLESLLLEHLNCKIIIHSNERSHQLKGSDFASYGFNGKTRFNLSIIEAIKHGIFEFDGFGSRCSAKNDNTEDVKRFAPSVYGAFLTYDYKQNEFFSIKSDSSAHISSVYRQVREKINKKKVDIDARFYNNTPIAKLVLEKGLAASTFSSSKSITISIVRYIEEICNNLLQ